MTRKLRIGLLVCAGLLSLVVTGSVRAETPATVDLFVAGTQGYHSYRIPAIIGTKSGALLAFCEGRKTGRGDDGDIDMVLRRSLDQGKTWEPMQLVYEDGGTAKITIGNPCPVQDQETGTIWLPFTRNNDDVYVMSSRDDGQTWSEPRKITADVKSNDWTWYATGPGNAIQLQQGPHKGRLVIPCDHRAKPRGKERADWNNAGRSHIFYSDDHGETWKLGGASDWGMNECAVVELMDGSLMLNMRSYRGKGCRGVAVSKDGGLTWGETRDEPTLIESVCQGSFIRYAGPSAKETPRLLFCNPATTKGRHHLTVRASADEGRTWPVSKLICEGSSAYSSLVCLPDGRIGLVYERDDYKRISYTAFSLDWVLAGDAR